MQRVFDQIQFYLKVTAMFLWLILACLIAMPLALVRFKNPNNNKMFAVIYGPIARFIMGLRVEVQGQEKLSNHKPCIYMCNHQSALDLTTFEPVYTKGTLVIGKKEVARIPFFGLMFVAFGNVLINRQDRTQAVAGLNEAVDTLKKRSLNLWIFPEGTRNKGSQDLLPFKKGPFHMAVAAEVPIVPMVCQSIHHLMSVESKRAHGGVVKIRVLDPIFTKGKTTADVDALLSETYQKMQQVFQELNADRNP